MVKSAVPFFAGQEEGNDGRGDSLGKDGRSLAAQRFRQVTPATDQSIAECGLRIAKSKLANFKPPFRNPQFAYPQFCL
jgi:hypothetical protein